MSEPVIRINGIPLTQGESMTIRCAIEGFASSLRDEGLGDDEHGIAMTKAYLANIDAIRAKIFGGSDE